VTVCRQYCQNTHIYYKGSDSSARWCIPSYHLRLRRAVGNPMIHIWTVHARGIWACYLQSTYQNDWFLCHI